MKSAKMRSCCRTKRGNGPHESGCKHTRLGRPKPATKRPREADEDPDERLCIVKEGVKGWVARSGTRNWKPYTTTARQTFEEYTESGTAVVFVRDGWQLLVRMRDVTGLKM